MNKLEAKSYQLGQKFFKEVGQDVNSLDGFIAGFDAAIALNLPVKFADWRMILVMDKGELQEKILLHFGYFPNNKELFDYWLNNIWKHE